MARVNVPKNADQIIQLAQRIVAKHAADGAGSPLAGINMADMSTKTSAADTENKKAVQCRRDGEKATQSRDLALGAGDTGAAAGTPLLFRESLGDVCLG